MNIAEFKEWLNNFPDDAVVDVIRVKSGGQNTQLGDPECEMFNAGVINRLGEGEGELLASVDASWDYSDLTKFGGSKILTLGVFD